MSKFLDKASVIMDDILPSINEERITFRKFDGEALSDAAENGTDIPSSAVETIILQVNPTELSWASAKITSKVPSNSPGRFIIFNWGNDLDVLNISGTTGNMHPSIALSTSAPGLDTISKIADVANMESQVEPALTLHNEIAHAGEVIQQKVISKTLKYFDMLNLSPKYRAFKKLHDMYRRSDPEADVITLEMGDQVLRGYFSEFRFRVSASNTWEWKYDITYVVLQDLSVFDPKKDGSFPTGSYLSEE